MSKNVSPKESADEGSDVNKASVVIREIVE